MNIENISVNNAVKAIIFRKDGKFLMQQRDYAKGLPFPGRWTFFGGSINKNEKFEKALKRELYEELNFLPKKINKKLFKWTWKSDWSLGHNHFFPIYYDLKQKLVLKEGISMKWFTLNDLILNPTTPDVYENFDEIYNFLNSKKLVNSESLKIFEKCLLKNGNFKKKNNKVFYTLKNLCKLSRQIIFLLMNLAKLKKQKIFRICMHIDDKLKTHEMLMMHIKPVTVGPLKQAKNFLSYHILEGEMLIRIMDNNGKEINQYILSNNNGFKSLRLKADKFRKIITKSPFAIFLEVASGPFKDSDTIWFNNKSKIKVQKDYQGTLNL